MIDHDPTSTGPGASPEEVGEKIAATWRSLRLETFPPDQQAAAGGQMLLGLLDIFGVTIAKLTGRGLIDAPSLRLDLLGQAKIAREQGNVIRGAMVETVAFNLEPVIAELEQARKNPDTPRRPGNG